MNYAILSLLLATTISHASWKEALSRNNQLVTPEVNAIIMAQYRAYMNGNAPAIAHDSIKKIPIYESHEELVDINLAADTRIKMLPNPAYPFASVDCNSGLPAASKVRKSLFLSLQKMIAQIDRLAPHFGYQPGQIEIKVFEGLRDLKTQTMLFEHKQKEIAAEHPQLNEADLFNETAKWISPVVNNVPVHSTGAAVDLRLWDNVLNQFIDMGKFGVITGKNLVAPTFATNLTPAQINNRLLLLSAANSAGLTNYVYEWWHFSLGDRYACFWHNLKHANYGSVN